MIERERVLERLREIEERERGALADRVHSGLLQDVIGTDFLLQGAEKLAAGELRKRLAAARKTILSALDHRRRLIADLRPMIVDRQGIVNAIDFYIAELESRSPLKFRLSNHLEQDIVDPFWCGTVFRIVQAAMNNVESHSQSSSATVETRKDGQNFLVVVLDDGVGFDLGVASQSLGLRCMHERAELLGGSVSIQSKLDEGTSVRIVIPWPSLANKSD